MNIALSTFRKRNVAPRPSRLEDGYRYASQARGTQVIAGDRARRRRNVTNEIVRILELAGFEEIVLPTVERAELYSDKAGEEVLGQMYAFPDKKGRSLCLRPEGTATVQAIAPQLPKDAKLFYVADCFRYERPQRGRYRQFTQVGVEIVNPTEDYRRALVDLGEAIVSKFTDEYEIDDSAKRGLAYYTESGFEISVPKLGTQSQVLGGGRYPEGIGFAIGLDRLLLSGENK